MKAFWTHEGIKNWDYDDPVVGEVFQFHVYGIFDRQLTAEYGAVHNIVLEWAMPYGDKVRIQFGRPCYPGDCTVFITDPDVAMLFKLRFF